MDDVNSLSENPGFFTRAQAHDLRYGDKEIASAVRSGEWVRFRRGSYCLGSKWRALDDVGRHIVRCRAVVRVLGPAVALSHVSSGVMQGQDVWRQPLERVHVTRLDTGSGRVEGDVVHHVGRALRDQVIEVDGIRMIRPVRAALEAASRVDKEAALSHLESMLRAGHGTTQDLCEQFKAMEHWPFFRRLRFLVPLCDERSGSVGESRGNWLFMTNDIPRPVSQFEVRDASGAVVAICDWAWPELGVVGEFDGRIKYGRLLRPNQTPGDAVFAEKRREDLVRELTDMRMIRLVWDDYEHRSATVRRLQSALGLPA